MESSDINVSLIENNKNRIIAVIPLLFLSFGITVTHVIQGGPSISVLKDTIAKLTIPKRN